jgi:hypothetical protein
MKPGDGKVGEGGVQDHMDRLTAAWFRCRPKLWLVGGPRRSAVPSGCGSKWNLQVELLEPAFIVFRVPFYK